MIVGCDGIFRHHQETSSRARSHHHVCRPSREETATTLLFGRYCHMEGKSGGGAGGGA